NLAPHESVARVGILVDQIGDLHKRGVSGEAANTIYPLEINSAGRAQQLIKTFSTGCEPGHAGGYAAPLSAASSRHAVRDAARVNWSQVSRAYVGRSWKNRQAATFSTCCAASCECPSGADTA